MDAKDIGMQKEVGSVSVEALKLAASMVKEGARLADVAEAAEGLVLKEGFGIAFPINISVNEQAAHYTPSLEDDRVFKAGDIVKLDFGAEKEGLLGDVATTVVVGEDETRQKLSEATKEALEDAISVVRKGASLSSIGKAINSRIESMGFKPIKNLGGHGVERHDLHHGIFIPNYDNGDDTTLEEGELIAIEPFATLQNGKGMVVEGDSQEIFQFVGAAQPRSEGARKLIAEIESKYPHEPFAARWLKSVISDKFKLYASIRELQRLGAIEPYPVLVEAAGAIVSQHEAEMIVGTDSCEVVAIV
ncbi:MAG: type II methionyl aminopeptidase [Candidatus Micrarchaeia archaeon]